MLETLCDHPTEALGLGYCKQRTEPVTVAPHGSNRKPPNRRLQTECSHVFLVIGWLFASQADDIFSTPSRQHRPHTRFSMPPAWLRRSFMLPRFLLFLIGVRVAAGPAALEDKSAIYPDLPAGASSPQLITLEPGPHLFLDDHLIAASSRIQRRVNLPRRDARIPIRSLLETTIIAGLTFSR